MKTSIGIAFIILLFAVSYGQKIDQIFEDEGLTLFPREISDSVTAKFKKYDGDGDGFLSADDLRSAGVVSSSVSDASIRYHISRVDEDKDGLLNLEEFSKIMARTG